MRNDPRLATDPRKRELFGRLAEHYKVLAAELEKSIADPSVIMTPPPFPKESD